MNLSQGYATASLVNVPSTLDPRFLRVSPRDAVNSYLYMKVVGDPRIGIPVSGTCSASTLTSCASDADCPAGQACSLTGERMPKNAPPLSQEELSAIADWIADGIPRQDEY